MAEDITPTVEPAASEDAPVVEQPKRRRGRPRKTAVVEEATEAAPAPAAVEEAPAEEAPKRRRGRPRKVTAPAEDAPAAQAPEAPSEGRRGRGSRGRGSQAPPRASAQVRDGRKGCCRRGHGCRRYRTRREQAGGGRSCHPCNAALHRGDDQGHAGCHKGFLGAHGRSDDHPGRG